MKKLRQISGWTAEEDKKLIEMVAGLPRQRGGHRLAWNVLRSLVDHFPGRTYRSIFERDKLIRSRIARTGNWEPKRRYKEWTQEEEAKLRELYAGNNFHMGLKDAFPGRKRADVVAKAGRLNLTRKFLPLIPFHLSPEDRAFAAGMINGDGSVGTYRIKDRPDSWTDYVQFGNTERAMIDWFTERIPRGTVTTRENGGNSDPKKWGIISRKTNYLWILRDRPTLAYFLEMIYPYLLGGKKERAEKILNRIRPIVANNIAESYLKTIAA